MSGGLGKYATGWRSGMIFTRRRRVLRIQWGGVVFLSAIALSALSSCSAIRAVVGWF